MRMRRYLLLIWPISLSTATIAMENFASQNASLTIEHLRDASMQIEQSIINPPSHESLDWRLFKNIATSIERLTSGSAFQEDALSSNQTTQEYAVWLDELNENISQKETDLYDQGTLISSDLMHARTYEAPGSFHILMGMRLKLIEARNLLRCSNARQTNRANDSLCELTAPPMINEPRWRCNRGLESFLNSLIDIIDSKIYLPVNADNRSMIIEHFPEPELHLVKSRPTKKALEDAVQ